MMGRHEESYRHRGAPVNGAIGTLNEKPLHAALKEWYALPGDQFEVSVDGFIADIVRGDLLIEVQTRHLVAMKRKLHVLVEDHPLRLVYPIAAEKWILRVDEDGETIARRRSPRRGAVEHVFAELVSFPGLLGHPNFTLEVLLIREEEIRQRNETGGQRSGRRNWRAKGWVTRERRLLEVLSSHVLSDPASAGAFIPAALPQPFTTRELATASGQPMRLCQKMAYCLREMGVLTVVGKRGRSTLFERSEVL
jgi:hypothetical protein